MRAIIRAAAGGSAAFVLLCAAPIAAQAQKTDTPGQGAQAPAAPSATPAKDATPPAVKQEDRSASGQSTGTQQAAPSVKPGAEATPQAIQDQEKTPAKK